MNNKNTVSVNGALSNGNLPISNSVLALHEEVQKYPHLRDLPAYEVDKSKVTIIIGVDTPSAIVPLEVRSGDDGEPFAIRTKLGWGICGPVRSSTAHDESYRAFINFVQTDSTPLETMIENLWRVDHTDDVHTDECYSQEDRRVLQLFETAKLENGRYVVAIPFKNDRNELPNNKKLAEYRLSLLRKRLRREPSLATMYIAAMENMFTAGYAEIVEDDAMLNNGVWYLPHHAVTHPEKPNKVRVVFDCSAMYQGLSLNKCVSQGPDLANNMVGVLLRFRFGTIAVKSDIESMFYQIKVIEEDRNMLRFMWYKGGEFASQPIICRMTVHPFGGTWSPSCANFTLRKVLRDSNMPERESIIRSFYVDDFLKAFDKEDEAVNTIQDVKETLKQSGFELKKWTSNQLEVLKQVPKEEQTARLRTVELADHTAVANEKSLGILWNVETDNFAYDVKVLDRPPTKRGVLSIISSAYDPLGLLCPFILKGKRIFQELTRKGVGWDDTFEDELSEWNEWKIDLTRLRAFKIPRCVKPLPNDLIAAIELHHFSDASSFAYGAATYMRVICKDGNIFCYLLLAKSRLAPIKAMTVPRLELTAATVAVKLNAICKKEIETPINSVTYWCDSMITLQYIRATSKRFKTFVANRVSVILEQSSPAQWFHIPSEKNVADDLSRGLSAEQIMCSDRWLVGPQFLYEEASVQRMKDLSSSRLCATTLCEGLEVAADVAVFMSTNNDDELLNLILRRSSWFSLKRTMVYIFRAVTRFKMLINKPSVVTSSYTVEHQVAALSLLRYVQHAVFSDAMTVVMSNGTVCNDEGKKVVSGLETLEPELNDDGLLCVGSRIARNRKQQVILPRRHHITELIVKECHERLGHSGREHVISVLRECYWIVRVRCVVKKVLKECVVCKRRSAKPCTQKMANLPEERITGEKPPFYHTGVDYFGPFNVKLLRNVVKRYCCLFTCLESRAVHIEVAEMLDTNSFINALRRFLCRRGPVQLLWSDNGTNFVGAQAELKEAIKQWNQGEIEQFCARREVEWKFNPPYAPHMGGVWERLVGSTKRLVNVLLKEQTLSEEALRTVMCEIECILNSRPLTTSSDDPKDLNAITPASLLTLRCSTLLPPGIFDKKDCYSRRRWKQIQFLADEFWRRWRKEYIPSLQLRSKWRNIQQNLVVGDVVLVVEENQPRNVWSLGRVVATYPSADGLVRSVDVCTKSGTYRRPIHKLCLLESDIGP
jgi:transposase InsO family protein